MKARTLRFRMFSWIAGILFILFLLNAVVLLVFNVYEWQEHQHDMEEEIGEFFVLLALDALMVPVTLGIAWAATRKMVKPVKDMAQAANRIREGAFEERLPVRGEQELSDLARSLNDAFNRYQETLQRFQQFAADASHQLRTPLTAIRTTGEVALASPRTEASYRETIGEILDDAHRLGRIIEQLLELCRIGGVELRDHMETCRLPDILDDVCNRYEPLCDDRGIRLQRAWGGPGLSVVGISDLLSQAVGNLVDNAVRHVPDGGIIRVSAVRADDGTLLCRVEDSGEGIDDAYKRLIFERFKTTGSARSGGTGLGLAIVADIIKVHRGAVEVADSPLGGACFSMHLPSAS